MRWKALDEFFGAFAASMGGSFAQESESSTQGHRYDPEIFAFSSLPLCVTSTRMRQYFSCIMVVAVANSPSAGGASTGELVDVDDQISFDSSCASKGMYHNFSVRSHNVISSSHPYAR